MAIADLIGSVTSSPLTGAVGSLLLQGRRSIMGFFADVTVEEQHTDEMVITDHPVEKGSNISDHAYLMPPEVTMEIGWSESAGRLNGLLGDTFLGGTTSLLAVYQGLLALQSSMQPLIVSTGKRLYTDMLIKSLNVTTDLATENALMVKVSFRKVFITSTQETTVELETQADPAATAPVQNGGSKQPVPVSESILSSIGGGQVGGAYTVGGF